jgi:beta-phosphoglucomutase-like phosphatase (HAD superfamily)
MVVEDAEAGVMAAKAAGMKVLGISANGNLQQADVCIQNLVDKDAQFIRHFFS